jgi:hypothetical protein
VPAVDRQGGRRDADGRNCCGTACGSRLPGTGERTASKDARCVRGGADGKGLHVQYLAGGLLHI